MNMAHRLEPGLDRMAATRADTIWHREETLADGRLTNVEIRYGDTEQAILQMAAIVLPRDADNDVVGTVPVFVVQNSTPVEIPTHVATMSHTGRVLGVVSAGYVPIPLRVMISQWLIALVRAGGVPEILGTFNGGRDFFASVRVSDEWKVPGDHSVTLPNFNVVGNHTGAKALLGSFSTIRVVCGNTAGMYTAEHTRTTAAEDRIKAAWLSIRHTMNAEERIADAVGWITDGRARAESERALLARLSAKVISPQEVGRFIESYISKPENGSKRMSTVRDQQRDSFFSVLTDEQDLGNHVLGMKGISAYGLMQGVTRYEDWTSQINRKAGTCVGTRRAFRAFLGTREAEKATARDRIMEMTGVR